MWLHRVRCREHYQKHAHHWQCPVSRPVLPPLHNECSFIPIDWLHSVHPCIMHNIKTGHETWYNMFSPINAPSLWFYPIKSSIHGVFKKFVVRSWRCRDTGHSMHANTKSQYKKQQINIRTSIIFISSDLFAILAIAYIFHPSIAIFGKTEIATSIYCIFTIK